MQCQQCGNHQATVNMTMQINNKRMQVQLCQTCFQDIQNNMMNSGNFSDGNAHDAFSKGFFQGNGFNQTQTRTEQKRGHKGNGLLDQLGKNVTDDARAGSIDPVIGRDQEIKRVIETLNRRNKNNPVLIGEPGVGKTAIAEGLAVKIVEGDVPAKLM